MPAPTDRATKTSHAASLIVVLVLVLSFIAFAFFMQTSGHALHRGEAHGRQRGVREARRMANSTTRSASSRADELGNVAARARQHAERARGARRMPIGKAADADRARAVASERIKQALDASSVNVVVADESLQRHLCESGGAETHVARRSPTSAMSRRASMRRASWARTSRCSTRMARASAISWRRCGSP